MKTPGAVLILLLSSVALAGPGGGGGGGSHGGGGGGGSHASAGGASHGGGLTRGVSAAHTGVSPASLARAATPLARNTATATKPPPKPGFWRRHFHLHHANAMQPAFVNLCTEEDRRLGRCPGLAPHRN